MQRLHWAELPVASLHQRLHSVNLPEGGRTDELHDYCFFRQQQPGERPPAEPGAAMLELIRRQLFPGFALAFYEPLSTAAADTPPPPLLALLAVDAILLAPRQAADGWRGFLIAEDTAAGQVREFRRPGEPDPMWLLVPPPAAGSEGAVWAAEAACLAIQPSPDIPDSHGLPPQ